jgi:hypothetical protein
MGDGSFHDDERQAQALADGEASGWLRRFRIWLLLGTELFLKQPPRPRMATGGARARQRAGRDQRSGSTGRTLAAVGAYARSVSFSPASRRLHRPLFFIRNE